MRVALYRRVTSRAITHRTLQRGPEWSGEWLSIRRVPGRETCDSWVLDLAAAFPWDGCTGVPDAAGTDDASALHDAVYQAAELIAQVAGWSVRKVLRWADEVFLERMLDDGSAPAVAYTYYAGVRLLGGLYHGLRRWFRGPA